MNRKTTRAFALGLFIAAVSILAVVQFSPKPSADKIEEGYINIKHSEWERLQSESRQWRDKYEALLNDDPKTTVIETKHYHLSIIDGMSSKEVSEQLMKAGIIENANDFNDYLAKVNKQHLIQIGEYDLDHTMGFEEIAYMITKTAKETN